MNVPRIKKWTLKVFLSVMLMGLSASIAVANDFLEQVKAKVMAATQPSHTWTGPTTGPKAQVNKKVVYVASDMRNGGILGVSEGVQEAAQVIGWTVQIIDAQGTVSGRTAAFNQALALRPDGIILGGFDAVEQRPVLEQAAKLNIQVVGWHSGPDPGPMPGVPIFTNITTDSNDVAQIAAYYAIAQSNGKAGVVIFTDSAYAVAIAKSDAMANVIKECSTCKLLSVEDTPLAEVSNRMPTLTVSLLQRFGEDWNFALGINDLYFDFMGPALAAVGIRGDGKPTNLSAGDGSDSAYQRIRVKQYQAGTVPEPLNLHGWQAIDELNRAMSGSQPSGYATPVHLVTSENIQADGGDRNVYDPDNGYREAYRKIWGK